MTKNTVRDGRFVTVSRHCDVHSRLREGSGCFCCCCCCCYCCSYCCSFFFPSFLPSLLPSFLSLLLFLYYFSLRESTVKAVRTPGYSTSVRRLLCVTLSFLSQAMTFVTNAGSCPGVHYLNYHTPPKHGSAGRHPLSP